MSSTNIYKTYAYITDADLVSFMDAARSHQAKSFALLKGVVEDVNGFHATISGEQPDVEPHLVDLYEHRS